LPVTIHFLRARRADRRTATANDHSELAAIAEDRPDQPASPKGAHRAG